MIGRQDFPAAFSGTLGHSQFFQQKEHEERFMSDEGLQNMRDLGGRHYNHSMMTGNLGKSLELTDLQ